MAQATSDKNDHNLRSIFGFWVYLMTDCVLFASLFATFIVLRNSTYGGSDGAQLFSLKFVLVETIVLLTSSFTCGLSMLAAQDRKKNTVYLWLGLTFLLGLIFLTLELTEFRHLSMEGNSWRRSAFLSAFFTLVGTHGVHILVGLMWMIVMAYRLSKNSFSQTNRRRLTMFSLFWHFLDVIWIFIFTIVYLLGAIKI